MRAVIDAVDVPPKDADMIEKAQPKRPSQIEKLCGQLYTREVNLVAWLNRATEDEKEALVDLLVALELGEKRN